MAADTLIPGEIEEFVAALRATDGLDVGSLVFERVPSDVLGDVFDRLGRLERFARAAQVAVLDVLDRRKSPDQPVDPSGLPLPDDDAPPRPVDPQVRRQARLAQRLRTMPATKSAFDRGDLDMGQAEALAKVAHDPAYREAFTAQEPVIVDAVTSVGASGTKSYLQRWCHQVDQTAARDAAHRRYRRRSTRTWIDRDGFAHAHFSAADDLGARVLANFQRLLDADWHRHHTDDTDDDRTRDQRAADVFVAMTDTAVAALRSGRADARPETTVQVTIDYDDLLAKLPGVDLVSGMDLSGEAVRRLCCDAGISRLVTKGRSIVLDKGTTVRLATPSQRAALRERYGGCAGCGAPFSHCQIHHVNEVVAHRGETNINELIPACGRCHHRLHEGDWHLEPAAHGDGWDWIDPTGRRRPSKHRRRTQPHPGPTAATDRNAVPSAPRGPDPVAPPSLFDN